MKKYIKTTDILKKDLIYISFFSLSIGSWVMFLVVCVIIVIFGKCPIPEIDKVITGKDIPFFLIVPFSITFVGFFIILYRYFYYKNLYVNGIVIHGSITAISKVDEYGMIDISVIYEYKGKHYRKIYRIQKAELNIELKSGDSIQVVIDPKRPNRFLILELFTE